MAHLNYLTYNNENLEKANFTEREGRKAMSLPVEKRRVVRLPRPRSVSHGYQNGRIWENEKTNDSRCMAVVYADATWD